MENMSAAAEAARHMEQDILKNIKLLLLEKGYARVSDLSGEMNINSNTMYVAVNKLVNKGYIEPLGPRGGRNVRRSLRLTEEGEKIARDMLQRHQLVQKWLIRLGLPEDQADREACSLEHGMTDTIISVLKSHVRMADQYMGDEMTAGEIMKKLAAQPQQAADTITDRSLKMIEKLGGLKGAERKRQIVEEAGGDDFLQQLVEQAKQNGGVESAVRQLRAIEQIVRTEGEDWQTLHRISNLGPLVKLQGTQEEMQQLANDIEQYGGLHKVLQDWTYLTEISGLQQDFGGLRTMRQVAVEMKKIGNVTVLRRLNEMLEPFQNPNRVLRIMNRFARTLITEISPEYFEKSRLYSPDEAGESEE